MCQDYDRIGLGLVGGFSYSLCYLITAQQFHMCHLCHGMPDAFYATSQRITHPHALPLTQCIQIPSLLCNSLALGVLLGGVGDGEICERGCQQIVRKNVANDLNANGSVLGENWLENIQIWICERTKTTSGAHTGWQRLLQLLDLL